MKYCAILVLFGVVTAESDYERKLTKLWSIRASTDAQRTAVVNVTSASIVIQPTQYGRSSRISPEYKVGFRPRTIPRIEKPQDSSLYYQNEDKRKSEVLFPGNYFPIPDEKSKENATEYNPLDAGPFHPQTIPLIRSQEYQKRSLDEDEEPIIEKPEGFLEPTASRRSISYLFDAEPEDEEEEEEEEDDGDLVEDIDGKKHRKKAKKPKKISKYMLPLLLAYKLKYFAMIPLMVGGLVLLVGATGLAGFFFALFAAVMGLQKGSY